MRKIFAAWLRPSVACSDIHSVDAVVLVRDATFVRISIAITTSLSKRKIGGIAVANRCPGWRP